MRPSGSATLPVTPETTILSTWTRQSLGLLGPPLSGLVGAAEAVRWERLNPPRSSGRAVMATPSMRSSLTETVWRSRAARP